MGPGRPIFRRRRVSARSLWNRRMLVGRSTFLRSVLMKKCTENWRICLVLRFRKL
ncbi:auxin response factor 18 [Phtheirospermum japonicum]|uniref:Auxin response factor 18 n=1 Tax=Phtheirospermum japonicum TaxID=374723 RepID=A0A830BMA9_9LAMI|nr:auxin response factor 18 [Phtheirospermum japonicum]